MQHFNREFTAALTQMSLFLSTPFSSANVARLVSPHWLRYAMTSLRNFLFVLRDGGARDRSATLTSHGSVQFRLSPRSPQGHFSVYDFR